MTHRIATYRFAAHGFATHGFLVATRQRLITRLIQLTIAGYAGVCTHIVYAGPAGEQIVAGIGEVVRPTTDLTQINQSSNRLAIDWDSFDIRVGETVRFNQPGRDAIALNRIYDGKASEILGNLQSNGQLFLVNPRGIVFGRDAVVNVGGLLATDLMLDPADFMDGTIRLQDVPGLQGAIQNQGMISAASGGAIALLGHVVENTGDIYAPDGHVVLASASSAIISFDENSQLGVAIDQGVLENLTGSAVDGNSTAVKNSGKISADGGHVLLTAKAGADVFTQAVNNEGIIEANSVRQRNGVIEIIADGDINQQGELNVSSGDADTAAGRITIQGKNITHRGSTKANSQSGNGGQIDMFADEVFIAETDSEISATSTTAKGGTIQLVGERTGILDRTAIDASGKTGGGDILIGGDFQGAAIANNRTSNRTVVSRDVKIKADAIAQGDGGKVIVWADDTTLYKGDIFARGGASRGDGGFVEVSGKTFLGFDGFVDTTAQNGLMGNLLLDPDQITIVNGSGGSDDTELADGQILFADGGGANWDISETVVEAVASNLLLQANQSITINNLADNELNLSSTGTVTFSVRRTSSGIAKFEMLDTNDTINLSGGAAFNLEVTHTNGDFDEIQITTGDIVASNNVSIFTDNTLSSASLGESLDITMNIGDINVTGNHNVAIKAFTKNINTGSSDDTGSITLNTGNIAVSGNGDVTVSAVAQNDNTNSADAGNIAITTGQIAVGGSGDVSVIGQLVLAAPLVQATLPTVAIGVGNIAIGNAGGGKGDISILADHPGDATANATETITLNGTTYGTQGDGTDGDITIDGYNILLGNNTTLTARNGGGTGADITLTANTINAQNNDLSLNVGSGNFGVNFSSVSNLDALSLTTSRDIYLGDVAGGGGDQSFSQANIDVLDNATSLTLNSDGNINVSDTNIASGAVIFQADSDNNNAGTLTIAANKTLTKTSSGTLTLDGYNVAVDGDVTRSVAGNLVVSPENLLTIGANGSLSSNGGNISIGATTVSMSDGATINSGAGTLAINVTNDATISGLTSTNNTTSAISISSVAGAILDAGETNTDITATSANARVNLVAVTGLGIVSDQLELNASAAQVSVISGDIAFSNTGPMTLNTITAGNGGINITSTGDMTISGAITATGASNGVTLTSSGGTFTSNAAITSGSGGAITLASSLGNSAINSTVDSNGGTLTINAGDDIALGASANVQSDNGNIIFAANTDADTDGGITFNAASVANAGTGTIALSGYEDIALTGLTTTNATSSAVTVTSTNGVISDAGDAATDISAINGRAVLNAQTTIGSGNALDLAVNQLDITSDAGGILNVINNRALSLIQAISNGVGGAIDVIVNNDASLTVAGNVTSNSGAINLRADDDVNVDAGVAISSANGNVTLRADNDSDVSGTGGAINLNATSTLNVGSGAIVLQADESIAVSGLTTTNATSSAVTITSTSGAITDGGVTDISAVNGGIVLNAVTGIGSGNALEIDSNILTATNSGANGITISDANDLALNLVDANSGAVNLTVAGALTDNNAAANNIVADALTLSAAAGIGAGNALEIDADTLTATNSGANGITISDSDTLALNLVDANSGAVNLTVAGALTDNNAAANNIVAGALTLSAATGIGAGNAIEIDADNLTATNSGANGITVSDADELALNNINAAAGDVSVTAVGLTLDGLVTGANVELNAGAGALVDGNGASNNIVATNATLTATTGIGSGNSIEMDVDNLTAANSGANGITVSDSDDLALNAINAAAGDVSITANGLALNDVVTGANVTLNAGTGAITDGNAGSNNIAATTATLTATTGIGSGNAIEMDADNLTATNSGANGITVSDSDGLALNNINASAGNVSVTAVGLTLNGLVTGTSVTLNAGTGAIADGNVGANNITATTATLTARTGIGSADALETQITNLQVTQTGTGSSGNTRIDNTGDLTLAAIDNNTTALGGSVFITTTGDLTVANNIIANLGTISLLAGNDIALTALANVNSGDGNIIVTADTNSDNNGGIAMTAGAVIDSRTGTMTLSAYEDIVLTGLTSTNTTNSAITVTTTNGSITDGGNTNTDIAATAVGSRVNLNAATGIGAFANPLELNVLNLAASTTSGDLAFSNAGALTLDGVSTNNGGINISASGDLTVASGGVTATGANNGVSLTSTGGDLATNGAVTSGTNGNILLAVTLGNSTINSTIDSNGGSLTVTAGDDIAFGASANLQSDNGSVVITANTDADTNGGITFNAASLVNSGSGTITLNAYEDIALTGLATTGTASVTSSNGAINDAGNTSSDILANALVLDAATGIGSGNALEIDTNSLSTNNVSNATQLTDSDDLTINGADGGSGVIDITAAGNIALTAVTTTNATGSAVAITSTTGSITDGGNVSTDITATAVGSVVSLNAATGIGTFVNPLELNVLNLVSNTTSGDLAFGNTGNVTLNGETTSNGAINISATGDLTVAAGGVTATGANNGVSLSSGGQLIVNGVVTSGANGNILLAATVGNSIINSALDSNGGAITVTAGDDLNLTANADMHSDNGNIVLTANTDADTNGAITFDAATLVDADSGTIALSAYEDISLTGLVTSNATSNAVTVTSTQGAINDAGDASTDISAENGRVVLNSQNNIGSGNALELSASALDATNDASGVINIINDRALSVARAISNGIGGAIDIVVNNDAALTIAGNIDSNGGAINLRADDDVLVNTGVAITSGGGAITLAADNDADASGSGGTINFVSGSSLQAGGGDVVATADEFIQLAVVNAVDNLQMTSSLNRFAGVTSVNTLSVNGDTEITADVTTLTGGMTFANLAFINSATLDSAAALQVAALQLGNSGLAVLQTANDGDVTIGAINGNGQSLQISSSADIDLGAANLGAGDITLTADSNNNQASQITVTTVTAGDVLIEGSVALDDQFTNANNTVNAASFVARSLNSADLQSITTTGVLTVDANTINLGNDLASGAAMSLTGGNINLLDSVLLSTTNNSAGARLSLRGALDGNGHNLQLNAGNDVICCDQLTIADVNQLTVVNSARTVFGSVTTLGDIVINASQGIYLNDNVTSGGSLLLNANSDLDGSGIVALLQGKTITAAGDVSVQPGVIDVLLELANCDLSDLPAILSPDPVVEIPLDGIGAQEGLSAARASENSASDVALVSYLDMGCTEDASESRRKKCKEDSSMMDFLGTFLIDNQLPSR